MKGEFREIISKYCSTRNDLLPGGYCNSFEDYLKVSKMNKTGTGGTDQEILLAALILKTDTFVDKDSNRWMKFSGYSFNDRNTVDNLTDNRVYLKVITQESFSNISYVNHLVKENIS